MVVALAVVPHQLDIIERLLHESVFIAAQFFAGGAEVHGVLDDEGVVGEAETCVGGDAPFQSTGAWNS